MKILDRYILTRFLAIMGTALAAFILIFVVVDLVENMDKFIDAKMPQEAIVAYYLYTIPWFVSISLPMSTLLATFFSMGMLNKRNEITAMKASGFSIRRIGAVLLIMGVLISIGSFFFDDQVVSEAQRQKAQIQSEYLAREYRRQHQVRKQDIFKKQKPNEYLAIDRYDYRDQQIHGAYLQRFEEERLRQRLDFQSLTWDEDNQMWRGQNYMARTFDLNADTIMAIQKGTDTLITLAVRPMDLVKMSVTPEEMRFGELKDFVAHLIRDGTDPTRYQVNMHFKVAFACTSFIMVLFGLPLSIGRPRTSLTFGAGLSIFVIFGYYVTIKLGQSLGFKGLLPPLPSVWLPNLLFLTLGFILLRRSRT
jgi:lipopolysaccharide export system permease protein